MSYDNVELHNIEEVRSIQGHDGVRLQLVPENVRLALNKDAQLRMLNLDSAEISFVADSHVCCIRLSSEGPSRVTVFNGLFDSRHRFVLSPEPQTIEVVMNERLQQLDKAYWSGMIFSPWVYRLILDGLERGPVFFHDIEGQGIRVPKANEIPSLRYLAYGTSINGMVKMGWRLAEKL